MNKQITYEKSGRLRFVGHLDFMRTIHRAMRRAEIPLSDSQGFNPHPHMSFASPLALGWNGEGEIMEFRTEQDISDEEILDRLGKELPEGIRLLSCRTIPDKEPPIMAKIQAASYRIHLPEDRDWRPIVDEFLSSPSIVLKKMGKVKGRKQEVEVEVKPWIYNYQMEDQNTLFLICACGSEQNLKPDLLIYELYQHSGELEKLKYAESISRVALFGKKEGKLINYSFPEGSDL